MEELRGYSRITSRAKGGICALVTKARAIRVDGGIKGKFPLLSCHDESQKDIGIHYTVKIQD